MSDPITTGGHRPQDQVGGTVPPSYEPIETSVRTVVKWLVALGVGIVAALAICFFILAELTQVLASAPAAVNNRIRLERPAPRLKYDSPVPRKLLNHREEERLTTSGWVDREEGVARIPIEQAMGIIVKQSGPKSETSDRPASETATE